MVQEQVDVDVQAPSGNGGSLHARLSRRAAAIGAVAFVTLALAVATGKVPLPDSGPQQPTDGEATSTREREAHGGVAEQPRQQITAQSDDPSALEPSAPAPGPEGVSGGNGSVVVVGDLRSNRLVAAAVDSLLAPRNGGDREFPVLGVSPVVGAPLTVAKVGDHLVVTATNQADLVRLDKNLGGLRTLSLKSTLGTMRELWYGGVVPIGNQRVIVGLSFQSTIALVEVDVNEWVVKRHVTFKDRFASRPRLCSTGGSLFLLTTRAVDVVDINSLARIGSTAVPDQTLGLVCTRTNAWIASASSPKLTEVTPTPSLGRSVQWEGVGGNDLLYDSATDTLFGSDQVAGRVFACSPTGGCRVSDSVGVKPTHLLLAAGRLITAVESSYRLVVLDPKTLRGGAHVAFPGTPRGLASLR